MPAAIDITGERYHWLLAIEPTERRSYGGQVFWRFACLRCGAEHVCVVGNVRQGLLKSCGCFKADAMREMNKKRRTYARPVCLHSLAGVCLIDDLAEQPPSDLMSARAANQKYTEYRETACEFVLEAYRAKITTIARELSLFVGIERQLLDGLEFVPIDDRAIGAYHATADSWQFDWSKWYEHFWRNDPDRFDVAIWQKAELCGLAIGRPSTGNDNVTIHVLERRSDCLWLKGWVAQIVTDVAEAYAKVLRKQRVKLKNPVEGAIPTYRRLGFELAESINSIRYYARRVGE